MGLKWKEEGVSGIYLVLGENRKGLGEDVRRVFVK